jgi:membrane-anchored protein YejM (alkaline phosphatase superfamily)
MKRTLYRILGQHTPRLEDKLERQHARDQRLDVNFLLITLDSCRYDAFCDARTPVLDSFGRSLRAQSPANYTYAAHQSFFVGILPNVSEPVPYYNRFTRQLVGLIEVGETPKKQSTYFTVVSNRDAVDGFRRAGFQTVGTGAMNWFRQSSLTASFEQFEMLTNAEAQINYVLRSLDTSRRFFAFINFGETHDPFHYQGKLKPCPVRIQARRISWPPQESGLVGRKHEAYWHQVEAIEFVDRQLDRLFVALPANTVVVMCGDHGECFGEDGYWGHGINHPKVFDVPLGIFRLDRRPIEKPNGVLAHGPKPEA